MGRFGRGGRPREWDPRDNLRNTSCHIQVLGTGTDTGDTTPSVLLFFDKQRYLFNVGEGFQRFTMEHRVKLNKFNGVLVTRVTTEAAGGLPGMLLTLTDGTPGSSLGPQGGMTLYGPKGLSTLVAALRTFINVQNIGLNVHEFGNDSPTPNSAPAAANPPGAPANPPPASTAPNAASGEASAAASAPGEGAVNQETSTGSGQPQPLKPVVDTALVKITPVMLEPNLATADPESAGAGALAGAEAAGERDGKAAGSMEADGGAAAPVAAAEDARNGAESGPSSQLSSAEHVAKRPRTEPEGPQGRVSGGVRGGSPQGRWQPLELADGEVSTGVPEGPAACYICELPPVPGKFDVPKANSLGVRKGPDYGRLQRGETVTGSDGQQVRPEQVMGPTQPGPATLVADCPSTSYLGALLDAPALRRFRCAEGGAAPEKAMACVVHLTPGEVAALPEYQAWMRGFGPDTTHLMVNPRAIRATHVMARSAIMQAKLNTLAPQLFPLHSKLTDEMPADSAAQQISAASVPGTNMLKYTMRPLARKGLDQAEVPEVVDLAEVQRVMAEEEPEAAAAFQTSLAAVAEQPIPREIQQVGDRELEIIFLGTGAAMPSKYRNVTGIYLNFFDRGGMLLDCGEGSYGQLVRRFGAARADEVVKGLKCVWISHIHADHHAGLPRILAVRRQLMGDACPPLTVLGPRPLRRPLAAYSQLEPMTFRYIDLTHTVPLPAHKGASEQESQELNASIEAVTKQLGLAKLQSVRVQHCAHAYGVVLEGEAGWKLAFSGDTRPCDAMVTAARNATVLIHEATFDDDLEEDALFKNHSMTSEAVEVGRRANAYRTILTHFSQRYPKIPIIAPSFQRTTCIAFDLMSVNLKSLPLLPTLVPALQVLFRDAEAEENGEADLYGEDGAGGVLDLAPEDLAAK